MAEKPYTYCFSCGRFMLVYKTKQGGVYTMYKHNYMWGPSDCRGSRHPVTNRYVREAL